MPIVNKPKIKQKKHGKKNTVRVSNKKAVKNGRAQPKPKIKAKPVKKVKEVTPSEQELLDEENARIESEVEAGFDDDMVDDDLASFEDMDETEDNL